MWKLLIDKNDVEDFYSKSTNKEKEELKNIEVIYTKVSDNTYRSKLPASLIYYGNVETGDVYSKSYILDSVELDESIKDLSHLVKDEHCFFFYAGVIEDKVSVRTKNFRLTVDNIEEI